MRELVGPLLTPLQGAAIDEAQAALMHVRERVAANQAEIDRSSAAVREHKQAFESAVNANDKNLTDACKKRWFTERDAHEAATLERDILKSMELRAEDAVRAAAWSQFGSDYQAVHDHVWQLYRAAHETLREKLSDPALWALVIEHTALTDAVNSLGHSVENIKNWRGVLFDGEVPGMAYRPRVTEAKPVFKGPVRDYGHVLSGDRPSGDPSLLLPVGAGHGVDWTDLG